jgi:hypothetical protein
MDTLYQKPSAEKSLNGRLIRIHDRVSGLRSGMRRKGISKIYATAGAFILLVVVIVIVRIVSVNYGAGPKVTRPEDPVPQQNAPKPQPSGTGSSPEEGHQDRSGAR